ncbi:Hypothetical predicted protein [Cloeon dipterum]|uniref:Tetraspanin n=2 Tax=Cloeon dipterum TaxID=197152 RepID=A0A8S1CPM5_9INSE|nr:Hypothetical predicted protein [Cloeon dipterum]
MGVCSCFCNVLNGIFKYAVFIFNLIFVLGGVTILILGALMETSVLDISNYIDVNIHVSAIVLMVSGGVIILVAFFGCCGAVSNNRCMLNIYASLLLLAFCLQVSGFVLVLVWNPDVSAGLEKEMMQSLSKYPVENTGSNVQKFWDTVQKEWECCGVHSRLDWAVYNPALPRLPDSCKCNPDFEVFCTTEGYYERGCYPELKDLTFDIQEAMGWTAIGLASFEVVVGILTLIYANSHRNSKKGRK